MLTVPLSFLEVSPAAAASLVSVALSASVEKAKLTAIHIEQSKIFRFMTTLTPWRRPDTEGSGATPAPQGFQPRPMYGIFVAMMVMNITFASSGKLAI
jgi:hypothetical protein